MPQRGSRFCDRVIPIMHLMLQQKKPVPNIYIWVIGLWGLYYSNHGGLREISGQKQHSVEAIHLVLRYVLSVGLDNVINLGLGAKPSGFDIQSQFFSDSSVIA